MMLDDSFFDRDACTVAKALLGKIIRVKHDQHWLQARIIETEAYELHDKASHASLGYTEKRRALFMPAGTIYMYYARGGDSLNVSVRGEGNAVLIKSAFPHPSTNQAMIEQMQLLNPHPNRPEPRVATQLMSGQTLLCKALGLKVPDWDAQNFNKNQFYIENQNIKPESIIQTTRLGIPIGRDEHLPYRFIDSEFVKYCSKPPRLSV